MSNPKIKTKEQLIQTCKDEGLPADFKAIWNGNAPNQIHYDCENPSDLFRAFVSYPEMFPHAEELLILWSCNGDHLTGYLTKKSLLNTIWKTAQMNSK